MHKYPFISDISIHLYTHTESEAFTTLVLVTTESFIFLTSETISSL